MPCNVGGVRDIDVLILSVMNTESNSVDLPGPDNGLV